MDRPTVRFGRGLEGRASASIQWMHSLDRTACAGGCFAIPDDVLRLAVSADVAGAAGDYRLVSHTTAAAAGAAGGPVPPQSLVFFGGPVSAPGYELHRLVGARGLSERLELQLPVPFVAVTLGRFSRTPARATLAPYVNVVVLDSPPPGGCEFGCSPGPASVFTRSSPVFPSAGVGVLSLFDLVRLDIARGLGDRGWWMLSIDVTRDIWGIL